MQHLNISDLPIRVKSITKICHPLPDYPDCLGYANVAIDNIATVYAVKIYKQNGELSAKIPCEDTSILFFIGGIPVGDRKLAERIRLLVLNEWRNVYED